MSTGIRHHNRSAVSAGLQAALDPGYIQVDERTLADRLAFAAQFGELINYYDQSNTRNGDWSPFYLKDPVILIATISKTEYESQYANYCRWIDKVNLALKHVDTGDVKTRSESTDILQDCFYRLFLLLREIFDKINGWVVSMNLSRSRYEIKEFILQRIGDDIGDYLWDFVSLWQAVSKRQEILPPDFSLYKNFADSWQQQNPVRRVFSGEFDDALQHFNRIFLPVFSFYVQVIDAAEEQLEKLLAKPGEYPDTALLISFLKLLQVQQAQQNDFTEKHLHFYYRKILKQRPNTFVPDSVFVCCKLMPGIADFTIPQQIAFQAGSYPDKQPVIFSTVEPSTLNQIEVVTAATCWYGPGKTKNGQTDNPGVVNILQTAKPNQLKKNQAGQVDTWKLLGESSDTTVQHGFAFGTPELYLGEAKADRVLTLEFRFSAPVNASLFENANIYLSTAAGWYEKLDNVSVALDESDSHVVNLAMKLEVTEPAVEPFKTPPAGIDCQWPMIKVLMGNQIDLCQSPQIVSICIKSQVSGLTDLVLANKYGSLNASKPFQPFGPIVDVGSSFYLGSNELFAKLLESATIRFTWQALPAKGFEDYYGAYNLYLTNPDPWPEPQPEPEPKPQPEPEHQAEPEHQPEPEPQPHPEPEPQPEPEPEPIILQSYFSNKAFAVGVDYLAEGKWQSVTPLVNGHSYASPVPLYLDRVPGIDFLPPVQTTEYEIVNPAIRVSSLDAAIQPELLTQPLKYSTKSLFGFLRFTLKTPAYGFGSGIYSKVIANIAIHNAAVMIDKTGKPLGETGNEHHTKSNRKKHQRKSSLLKLASEAERSLKWSPTWFLSLLKFVLSGLWSRIKSAVSKDIDNSLLPPVEDGLRTSDWEAPPSPPYIPKVASIEVDYQSARLFSFNPLNQGDSSCDAVVAVNGNNRANQSTGRSADQPVKPTPTETLINEPSATHTGVLQGVLGKSHELLHKGHEIEEHIAHSIHEAILKVRNRIHSGIGELEHVAKTDEEEIRTSLVSLLKQEAMRALQDRLKGDSNAAMLSDIEADLVKRIEQKITGSISGDIASDINGALKKALGNQPPSSEASTKVASVIRPSGFQYYYFDSFANYKVFDNQAQGRLFTAFVPSDSPPAQTASHTSESGQNQSFSLYPPLASRAALFLSLNNVMAPTSVRLLFELTPDRTENSENSNYLPLTYSYLSSSGWKPMSVLHDSTNGLLCTGIIEFELPSDTANNCPLMPLGFYWLRLAVTEGSGSLPNMNVSILSAQAIKLVRNADAPIAPGEKPVLAAAQIAGPVTRIPEIQSYSQPFPSSGGKPAESKQEFRARLSQRIRNKDRCCSSFDYTEMIYQQFPQIYYVRPMVCQDDPGRVKVGLVRVVSGMSEPTVFNPSVSQCQEIEVREFLRKRISSQVRLQVFSLKHEAVRVTVAVAVQAGFSVRQVCQSAESRITQFLTPWVASVASSVDLDSGIKRSELLACIFQLDGVKAVNSLKIERQKLSQSDATDTDWEVMGGELIKASTEAILVPSEPPVVLAA